MKSEKLKQFFFLHFPNESFIFFFIILMKRWRLSVPSGEMESSEGLGGAQLGLEVRKWGFEGNIEVKHDPLWSTLWPQSLLW